MARIVDWRGIEIEVAAGTKSGVLTEPALVAEIERKPDAVVEYLILNPE